LAQEISFLSLGDGGDRWQTREHKRCSEVGGSRAPCHSCRRQERAARTRGDRSM